MGYGVKDAARDTKSSEKEAAKAWREAEKDAKKEKAVARK